MSHWGISETHLCVIELCTQETQQPLESSSHNRSVLDSLSLVEKKDHMSIHYDQDFAGNLLQ